MESNLVKQLKEAGWQNITLLSGRIEVLLCKVVKRDYKEEWVAILMSNRLEHVVVRVPFGFTLPGGEFDPNSVDFESLSVNQSLLHVLNTIREYYLKNPETPEIIDGFDQPYHRVIKYSGKR